MFSLARLGRLLLVPLLCTATASARQESQPSQANDGKLYLDVVVTPKSGPPVSGLQQHDFTLLDNKVPRTIASFRALGHSQAPLEIILVVDAVNTNYRTVAYEREEIDKFLHANGGHLAHPTAVAVFTDSGVQIQGEFSDDGNALSVSLDQSVIRLRTIRRSGGIYGDAERLQLSLHALRQIAEREAARPGRKVILWISPGWPMLTGARVYLPGSNEQNQIFTDIVSFSTLLREARITLYSIDPLGTADFGVRSSFWQDFTKGISKPSQTDIGDLALEVMATQSGGLALNTDNDVAGLLQKCIGDADAYYELAFDPPSSAKRDEYHRLEIKLTKPDLTARTRQGYYAQPDIK